MNFIRAMLIFGGLVSSLVEGSHNSGTPSGSKKRPTEPSSASSNAGSNGAKPHEKAKIQKMDVSSELEAEERKALIAKKSVDVPYHEQGEDPNCGIYALSMTLDFFHKQNPKNANPPARAGGIGDPGLVNLDSYAADTGNYIGDHQGNFPSQLTDIARAYGYKSTKSHLSTPFPQTVALVAPLARLATIPFEVKLQDLRDTVLREKRPVIVAVAGVDANGNPEVQYNPSNFHYIVIQGFVRASNGLEYAVVKHGWSGGDVLMRVHDIQDSWEAIGKPTVFVQP